MIKNKVVQAATMKIEIELRCSECNSPLIVNNTWSDIHGLSCYVEPCEECMSRRTQRAPDVCPSCAGEKQVIKMVLFGFVVSAVARANAGDANRWAARHDII